MLTLTLVISLLGTASAGTILRPPGGSKIKCPVVLSGQVSMPTKLTDFDETTSIFNPNYVRGNETWSQILRFPQVPNSRFDGYGYKSLEVTINDNSIFKTQYGFRRAGLQIKGDTNAPGPGNQGVKTLHWSVKQDPARSLNLTHEYLNVWHEAGDYSANQFSFELGTLIDQPHHEKNTFKFLDRQNEVIWSTRVDPTAWQNFAVTLNFEKNTLQVYYSRGASLLKPVTRPLSNDNSGAGQYQIGILKKPTGTDDVVNSGYQESGIKEGQIYGGIFVEDSANGCVSL